jgi:hypothetical protein
MTYSLSLTKFSQMKVIYYSGYITEPLNLLSDDGSILNIPITYKIDRDGDRSIIP